MTGGHVVKIVGTPGETEPASFVLRSSNRHRFVNVQSNDLISKQGHRLPQSQISMRVVKCWYQANDSSSIRTSKQRVLTPELLLFDDDLVKVDHIAKRNFLRVIANDRYQYIDISGKSGEGLPESFVFDDAETLQAFDLAPNRNQQVWVTITIPPSTSVGIYQGTIGVSEAGRIIGSLPIEVKVLPFTLADSMLEYAIYYRGILANGGPEVSSDKKSQNQYQRELTDIFKHGIVAPTLYQRFDSDYLSQAIELRDDLNISKHRLYTLGTTTANKTDPKSIKMLASRVRIWKAIANAHNYREIYIYGVDEAVKERLSEQKPSWDVVHRQGAKMFVALYEGATAFTRNAIDTAILSGYKPKEVEKWHRLGSRVLSYGNPQVGLEDPNIYRRNYGFKLWAGGYDGCMPYAYQHAFGHIWNDFDHPKFRDHVFAYPTTDGLVSTIQWEGFREAVDDVRYLSTLLALEGKNTDGIRKHIFDQLAQPKPSMNQIRQWLIDRILQHINQRPLP